MKIIYSPYYDGETFLGDQPDIMGVTYVGNMGLFDQLALRAGTHMEPISDVERAKPSLLHGRAAARLSRAVPEQLRRLRHLAHRFQKIPRDRRIS